MATPINVILSRDVMHLGHIGDVVRVRPGHARNFLFPRKMALPVSTGRVAQFEHQKKLVEHQRMKLKEGSELLRKKLAGVQVTVTAKSGEQGKLFGSIGTRDIEKALVAQGIMIDHRDIKLKAPIKSVGLHQIDVRLEADVMGMLNVVVVPEEQPVVAAAVEEATAETTVDTTEDTE